MKRLMRFTLARVKVGERAPLRAANAGGAYIQRAGEQYLVRGEGLITTLEDMTNFVPGLTYEGQLDRANIRGAGRVINAPGTDPAIALWREWAVAHDLAERLDRRHQELEAELAERVDGLGTTVCIPGGASV